MWEVVSKLTGKPMPYTREYETREEAEAVRKHLDRQGMLVGVKEKKAEQ